MGRWWVVGSPLLLSSGGWLLLPISGGVGSYVSYGGKGLNVGRVKVNGVMCRGNVDA